MSATFTSNDSRSYSFVNVSLGIKLDGLAPYLRAVRSSSDGPCVRKKLVRLPLVPEGANLADDEHRVVAHVLVGERIVRALGGLAEPNLRLDDPVPQQVFARRLLVGRVGVRRRALPRLEFLREFLEPL